MLFWLLPLKLRLHKSFQQNMIAFNFKLLYLSLFTIKMVFSNLVLKENRSYTSHVKSRSFKFWAFLGYILEPLGSTFKLKILPRHCHFQNQLALKSALKSYSLCIFLSFFQKYLLLTFWILCKHWVLNIFRYIKYSFVISGIKLHPPLS